MPADFHAYEKSLCRMRLVPLLEREGIDLAGKSVLDVGCGQGGVLAGLHERYPLRESLGIDLDGEMIRAGAAKSPDSRLEAGDFFKLEPRGYDLILMRDVLEHIGDVEAALERARLFLNPGGNLYATFAPFYSPFGGHQHNADGFFSNVPWIQFLPEPLFRRMLRLSGNAYKGRDALIADMDSVLATRLTVSGFRKAFRAAGFRARRSDSYLVRPDFRIKFGLPTVAFPAIPALEELACTGVEALLEIR